MDTSAKRRSRNRRHTRIRKHVRGTLQRPRLAVYRSNAGIYAQVIDDEAGRTLAAASSLDRDLPAGESSGESGKIATSRAVGRLVAARAQEAGVDKVVFDRGGNRYHGRVRALAEGARTGGLQF